MRRTTSLMFLMGLLSSGLLCAQHNNVWTFGDSVLMHFSTGSPFVDTTKKPATFWETCGALCDESGDLVFFGNETGIYDRNFQVIPGANLLSIGNSQTQGMIFIPVGHRYDEFLIYYFSGDCDGIPSPYCLRFFKLTSFGGIHSIQNANQLSYVHSLGLTEKIGAVSHTNGRDWWVIFHEFRNKNFVRFLITPNGILGPYLQSIGTDLSVNNLGVGSRRGQLSFSNDGTKLLSVTQGGYIDLFDFDRCTGLLSNWDSLGTYSQWVDTDHAYYGASFSPDGSKIYVSEGENFQSGAGLFQFDLNNSNILGSKSLIFRYDNDSTIVGQHLVAPDGKIYITTANGWPGHGQDSSNYTLSVINNPNDLGAACNFQPFSFWLGGRRTGLSLPNFPSFAPRLVSMWAEAGLDTAFCLGDSVRLGQPDTSAGAMTWQWTPSTGLSDPTVPQPWAKPNQTTTYYLTAIDTVIGAPCGETIDSVTVTIVQPFEMPMAIAGPDTTLCGLDTIRLGVFPAGNPSWNYLWSPDKGLSGSESPQPFASPEVSTTYKLVVSHESGATCAMDSDYVEITVEQPWTPTPASDLEGCAEEGIVLGLSSLPGFAYQWSPANPLNDPTLAQPTATLSESGDFVLRIEDLNMQSDCRFAYDTLHVDLVWCESPNVLTPNGDGFNDVLRFEGFNLPFKLAIFDRWGHPVFQSGNYGNDFDFRGRKEGVYYYVLEPDEAEGKETRKGWVMVVR